MLLKFIGKLISIIYKEKFSNSARPTDFNLYKRGNCGVRIVGKNRIPIKFNMYKGNEFAVEIPVGFKLKENDKKDSIVITKDFTNYNMEYDNAFIESYIHIIISKIKFEVPIMFEEMQYDGIREFILKSPAFRGMENKDIYVGKRKALYIKSNEAGSAGEIFWIIVPAKNSYFNIRIASRCCNDFEYQLIDEIVQSFYIPPEEENSMVNSNIKSSSKYSGDIRVEKSYFSKTDAV